MKRHPALHDLARDHFHVLAHALQVRRALAGEPGPSVQESARALVRLWRTEGAWHFGEEEEILLPVFARRHGPPGAHPQMARMLHEHARIREEMARLEQALEQGGDVSAAVEAAARQLHDHVRFEDRELFVMLEERLSPEELEEIGRRSRSYRLAHRGEGSLGPR